MIFYQGFAQPFFLTYFIAPQARPSPKGRFSRRNAPPPPHRRGEAAGFSRRITESYDSRDSAPAKTINPQRVPVIAKITFLPNRVKRGLIVFLNAKRRCNFSGGPPVKTGGFPAVSGRRGLRPLGKKSSPVGRGALSRGSGAGVGVNATPFDCLGGGAVA